ncbi:hypothetical protein Q9Q95_13560 [Sphingomonas sp. DG1-23]|uniref:hypothetical protein n=1 Tax=Sphingomonas sp. DG1-23 TaxID=3068316 RepID=UPI00273EDFA3|nr:hypothetical protein [Sphingomonas sp. DG1-23]MDP5279956.1 hypothetical protein [Sphingomonas sp. DG1-23]
MPKPSEFHIGVIEFFSILLPGALLTAALWLHFGPDIGGPARSLLAPAGAAWVAFALASYVAGHFLFLAGSLLDLLYDRGALWAWLGSRGFSLRSRRKWWIGRLRKDWGLDRGKPAADVYRDLCFSLVTDEKRKLFGETAKNEPMNNFAFAKSVLRLKAPAMLADVERYEADSKFFRSLVVTLPLAVPPLLPEASYAVWLSLGLSLAAFLRYIEQRHKSTEWAFRYLLVLNRMH